ncbi:MAG: hypothetical protein DHS20C18_50900 [Saprospiraceae bacterium]|nr:MAG: hypothetical protein DHS20C18_50900 [Saprospiraceae bacterium]
MSKQLTKDMIQDLIQRYKSELGKLEYQVVKTKEVLAELRDKATTAKVTAVKDPVEIASIGKSSYADEEVIVHKSPVRGRKSKTTAKKAKDKTKKITRNRKLSDWDQLILDGIEATGKTMINADLIELMESKKKKDKLNWDDVKLKAKLNSTLHKLANKKDLLVKVPYEGKGFGYALSKWATKKGDIPKKYMP